MIFKNLFKTIRDSLCCGGCVKGLPTSTSKTKLFTEANSVSSSNESSLVLTKQPSTSPQTTHVTNIFAIYSPCFDYLNMGFCDNKLNDSNDKSEQYELSSSRETLSTNSDTLNSEIEETKLIEQNLCVPYLDNIYFRNSFRRLQNQSYSSNVTSVFTTIYPFIKSYTLSPMKVISGRINRLATSIKSFNQFKPLPPSSTEIKIENSNNNVNSYGFTPFRQFFLRFTDANFI